MRETFTNPLTGEQVPRNMSTQISLRVEIKDMIKKLEAALSEIDERLLEDLEEEGGEYETDDYIAKYQQNSRKVFDVDKVVDLLDGQVSYTDSEGDRVDFYKPSVTAIKDYLASKVEAGELDQDKADLYKSSFYEKASNPFVRIIRK